MILRPDQATDPAVAGGKAAALARLKAAGFDVPDFVVIPAAAFAATAAGPRPARGLKPALARALAELGPGPFAVRSSARSEDGAAHSHAGQFATELNVPAARVADAAARVWASGFADPVGTYRALTTGEDAQPPAILVQRMVQPRAAGVAFSADPVSGRRDRAVIAAVAGLADRLVAGEVSGEDWTVARDGAAAGPERPAVLTAGQARAVAALAAACEAHFGSPQDIEWAFEGERLRLLQSRPVTTPLRPVPVPDDTLRLFDNSNIVESYPGLVSPLTFSFAAYAYDRVYRAFVRLLGLSPARVAANAPVFANLLARIDGRVYYALDNWYRALALLPGFSLTRGWMEAMMGVAEPLPEELTARLAPPPANRAAEALGLARAALGLLWQAVLLPRTRRRFLARLEAALAAAPETDRANLTALAAGYRRIERDLLDRWDAPLVNDFLCMIAFGASRGLLLPWAGDRGAAFHNDLMIGQGDIVSAEPAARIAAMGRLVREAGLVEALEAEGIAALDRVPGLRAAFDAYLAKFGDRCAAELKLESTPLTDDPAPLLAAVAAAARRPERSAPARPAPDFAALLPGRPVRARLARALCTYARARVRDRENLRFERTRIFGLARRVFRAMGRELAALGALDRAEDVFFLTVSEVLGAVEGAMLTQDLAALARLRRAEMEAAAARPDPPERLAARGPAFLAAPPAASRPGPAGGERFGTGCSAGTVSAAARVIHDPRTETLAPGEILVARATDPGWIAVFAGAAAIVVERGSLLSHSAIVARELGIPCVVGLADATRWIATGETIEVDGATGRVAKHDA
ncbi:MAG: PEP-utilizing enzyme [Rhodobacteraceae bacterium]|nr:PEP-utilizing enzyme [Paracoccaceae bacterium]